MKLKKAIYIVLGCFGVGMGAVGAVIPLLPSFPFLLLAAFCFAKSSQRLHTWFVNTKLYKKNLESYVNGRGMTWDAKIRIMLTVTVIMSVGFVLMLLRGLYVPCAILGGVWVFHLIYFVFGVKTLPKSEPPGAATPPHKKKPHPPPAPPARLFFAHILHKHTSILHIIVISHREGRQEEAKL